MQVFITPEAKKQYRRLPLNQKAKIKKKLNLIKQNAFACKKLAGKLNHLRSTKAWPYRIIYWINTTHHKIWIVSILHRQGAYR